MAACSNEVGNGIYSEMEGKLVEPEVTTMTVLEYDGDNNGLVSENLIRLTPEQESQGVFRYEYGAMIQIKLRCIIMNFNISRQYLI